MIPGMAERMVNGLKAAGVSFITYLPESRMSDILPLLEQDDYFTLVRTSHEGDAVSIACGALLAGKQAAVYTETAGVVIAIYHLHAAAINLGLPLVVLCSHVNTPQDKANNWIYSGWGNKFVPLLQLMGVPYQVIEKGGDVEERIADMVRAANADKLPAFLLLTGDFTKFEVQGA